MREDEVRADAENGACSQESLRTLNCADVQVLVRNEKEREHFVTSEFRG